MKRRAPKQPAKNHSAAHANSAHHSLALVLVDGTGVRKKIKKDYDKALRDLANSRRQLDQFNQTDVPQFQCWLNTHFGSLLTELRETSQKMAADEELVYRVQNEVLFGGGSYARAYKRVMEFRENPEPQPPPPNGDGDGESDRKQKPFGSDPDFEDIIDDDDPLKAFFNSLFGEFGPDDRPPHQHDSWGGHQAEPAARPRTSARLKELYRALVRRLHPDSQREMTAQKTEWWHQAQKAYQAGDVEQLEVILTLCEIGDSGTTAHTSASLLQRITAQLKSSLREIKRQISASRSDLAWNFSRRADHDILAGQMRRTLTNDLQSLQERWRQTKELIAGWKAAAEKSKKPRHRKPNPQSMEFPF